MPRSSRLPLLVAPAAILAFSSCAQRPNQAPLRSLDRSGRVALACIGTPEFAVDGTHGRPLSDCASGVARDITDFAYDPTTLADFPHTYALVTQETRGELAVIDLSVQPGTREILDADLSTPGLNFLPVGAQPVDVATSAFGAGAYVATAEPGRPGIYALPSNQLRGPAPGLQARPEPAATLRSWPACRLPSAPGRMLVVQSDLPAADPEARLCPGPNPVRDQAVYEQTNVFAGDATSLNVTYPGDTVDDGNGNQVPRLACGTPVRNELDQEEPLLNNCKPQLAPAAGSAEKLLVSLPETGELLIIDAQTLFDRPPGSFDPCPIEKAVKLRVDLPAAPPPEPPAGETCPALPATSVPTGACPGRPVRSVAYPNEFAPRPSAMALEADGRRLYVADEGAPVIHVLSLDDGCGLRELPPLLPSAFDEPERPVYTSALAVSPPTSDLRTFVYAVDREQGSLMAFDVSSGSGRRTPLVRERPDFYLGFSPRDRVRVGGGAVRDVTFVERSANLTDENGNIVNGACNPDSAAPDPASTRTAPDFGSGAGARPLRGVFAFATLTSGQVRVIDVDDLDAACRGYKTAPGFREPADQFTPLAASLTGCEACAVAGFGDTLGASGELSCNVVERHELRSEYYFANKSATGLHAPAPQAAPVLTLNGASLRTDDSEEARVNPKLLGPAAPNPYYDPNAKVEPPTIESPPGSMLQVTNPNYSEPLHGSDSPYRVNRPALGNGTWVLERAGSLSVSEPSPARAERNFIVPDFREPRAHIDQNWSVWYEATLPGFENRVADSRLGGSEPDAPRRGFFDPDAGFCSRGVQDRAAARLEGARLLGLRADTSDPAQIAALDRFGAEHADYVQIADELLAFDDPYWASTGGTCDYFACEATYGPAANPTANRDFVVREAYQDRVFVDGASRPVDPDCCFPTLVRYRVRAHNTWAVIGGAVGFLHRKVVDGATGRCVDQGVDQATGEFCDPLVTLRTGRAYEALAAPPAFPGGADRDGDGIADPRVPEPGGDPLPPGANDLYDACPDVPGVRHLSPELNGCPAPNDPRWPCRDELGNVAPDRAPGSDNCIPPTVGDRATFRNGLMHFVVYRGADPTQRDMVFSWTMTGGFVAMEVNLSRNGLVAPHSVVYSPALQRLVVTDGGQNGVMSLDIPTFGRFAPRTYL